MSNIEIRKNTNKEIPSQERSNLKDYLKELRSSNYKQRRIER
jgi:hypothetical protein